MGGNSCDPMGSMGLWDWAVHMQNFESYARAEFKLIEKK